MFQNRVAILINSSFFERDLRKNLRKRCDYLKLLEFLTCNKEEADQDNLRYGGSLNNENRLNDLVRAFYITAETFYRGNGLEKRRSEKHDKFLNALRSMNYEVEVAYNSIDSRYVLRALQIANSGTVDTIIMMGLTVDHVPLLWDLRSRGIRVCALFASSRINDEIRRALDWYYQIRIEDGFLTEDHSLEYADDLESDEELENNED